MADTQPTRVLQLVVKSGPDQGKMFFLESGREATIGRFASADLRLNDGSVSQKHCKVRCVGDLAFVEDLNSSNGTKVNGEPTVSRVLDEAGEIEIGATVIQAQWVETERKIPIKSVTSVQAPTLLESFNPLATQELKRVTNPNTMLEPSQMDEFREAQKMLGKMVGSYLLLEVIGVGDIGVVYRGKHATTRETAAVKVIQRATARNPQLLQRLLFETRPNLKIPRAASFIGTGEDGNYSFIASEIVKGRSLQHTVDGGKKFSPPEAVALALPLCEALGIAHAQQIFHRDVSPPNIMITPDNQPVLLDLGVGRKLDMEGRFILRKAEEPMNRLRYVSPEWTLAKPVTPAADVYSLAASLYFAVTGRPPFADNGMLELVRSVRWDDPAPLSTLRPELPEAFVKTIAQAMEKDPRNRYATMADFAAALKVSV